MSIVGRAQPIAMVRTVPRTGTVPTGLAGAPASLSFRLKPMFEEEARQRQVAGLRQGADFPVRENSPERGNVAENGGAAQKAAQPMRVADFSVKGTEQTSPSVASVCSVSRILIHVRFIAPSALSLWPLRTLVHAFPEISQGDHTRHALSREMSQGAHVGQPPDDNVRFIGPSPLGSCIDSPLSLRAVARPPPKMINASQDDHPRLSTNRKKTQEMAQGAQDDQGGQGTPVGRRRLQTDSGFVQEHND
jgi:hypothetical protein